MKNLEEKIKKLLEKVDTGDTIEPISDTILAAGIASNYGHGWENIAPVEQWQDKLENYFNNLNYQNEKTEFLDSVDELIKDYQGEADLNYIIEKLDFCEKLDLDAAKAQYINEFMEAVENNNSLNIEIIYHANALEYLMENDQSLADSLSLASDIGYSIKDLNSELLASLLATDKEKELFYELIEKMRAL
jgi:hypothetical protein